MCYRCGLCGVNSQPGEKMHKVVRYKERAGPRQILKEIPACKDCRYPSAGSEGQPPEEAVVSAVRTGGSKSKLRKEAPLCDVCNNPVGECGQVTLEGVRCKLHLPSRRRKN